MKKKKTYYKVVLLSECKKYVSAFARGCTEVEYRIGEFAEAPFGGLLVFDSLQNAHDYISDVTHSTFVIFECEAKEPVELPPKRATTPVCYFTNLKYHIKKFWDQRRKNLGCGYDGWPKGTLAFRKVKLTKMVA